MAIVCLVDGPKDLKPEFLARTIGKKALDAANLQEGELLSGDIKSWKKNLTSGQAASLEKWLKFRTEEGKAQFEQRVKSYAVSLAIPFYRKTVD